ncbi:hypothetical protein VUR80DRAFT_1597 [Thermomyces stellatus]
MARPAGSGIAPHTFQQGNQVNPMDMSPPNSPVGLDDAMRQLGTGYALHTSATHRPFLRQPQDDLARSIHHMDIRDPINGGIPTSAGAVVPRGLNPSPLVLPSQSVQAQNWALVQRQAGYGGVYGDAADFANPYMGQRGVTRAADEAYAYCFDRGDGEYTRLIPADMLPEMQDVPRRQRGADGMIVLPVPGGRAPRGVQGVTCPVRFKPRCCHPQTHRVADPIQNRIDTIVKSAPAPTGPKRNKVYCDKWVHEGTCAFTQQGCKFKHEMPLDRATQATLGLFHGLPSWWKKQQAELQRQREPASPTGSVASEHAGSSLASAGRPGAGVMETLTPGLDLKGNESSDGRDDEGRGFGAGERRAHSSCAFGPIGAPLRGRGSGVGGQRSGLASSRHNH